MNAIGGRTMWYCSCCGNALAVGRAICSCGGKSMPEEALMDVSLPEDTGPFGRIRHKLADFLGWRDGPR